MMYVYSLYLHPTSKRNIHPDYHGLLVLGPEVVTHNLRESTE